MKWLQMVIVVCLLHSCGYAFLKCQGTEIVDSSGNQVVLRGMGLGGWLVPEGYMLHTPGLGSPSSIHQQFIDVLSEKDTQDFFFHYRKNYINENDIRQIREWGFNSVRLPFHYNILSPIPDHYLEDGFAIIDSVITWCRKNELWVVLDMHCAPGAQNANNISDSDGKAGLWLDQKHKDHCVALWREIAQRYSREPVIAGYDLLNEPVLPAGITNSDLRALYISITRAIREVDTNHIIIIEGNWYATDFTFLTPPFDTHLVYSFHKYWDVVTDQSISSFLKIRDTWNVPLWAGEFGENSNHWNNSVIRMVERLNIGWCWWTHKKLKTLTSPLSAHIPINYSKLIDYWNGSLPKPSFELAKTILFEMTQNLSIQRCDYHHDVTASLLDMDLAITAKPFTELIIPGIIPCVDYDLGNNGIAYNDVDYQNVKGLGGAEWNKGWEYRSDGVDIEESHDPAGSFYSIGWIESGEWLKYTVTVEQTGSYDLVLRYSANSSNAKIRFSCDDKPIINDILLPSTQGWFNWRNFTSSGISLSAGIHQITLLIVNAGVNLNQIEFILDHTDTNEDGFLFEEEQDRILHVSNYPNPFQESTMIVFQLPKIMPIQLKVYNSVNEMVIRLAEGEYNAGIHHILWNGIDQSGHDVASGMYFCHLDTPLGAQVKRMVLAK